MADRETIQRWIWGSGGSPYNSFALAAIFLALPLYNIAQGGMTAGMVVLTVAQLAGVALLVTVGIVQVRRIRRGVDEPPAGAPLAQESDPRTR